MICSCDDINNSIDGIDKIVVFFVELREREANLFEDMFLIFVDIVFFNRNIVEFWNIGRYVVRLFRKCRRYSCIKEGCERKVVPK